MRILCGIILILIISPSVMAQFDDITDELGIKHAHVHAQLFGGGIASFDFNGDGFEDLFLTGGEGEDKLLLNDRNGGYTDISEALPHNKFKSEITSGVIYADFDRDGCEDLFITSFNREENCILLHNDCNEYSVSIGAQHASR